MEDTVRRLLTAHNVPMDRVFFHHFSGLRALVPGSRPDLSRARNIRDAAKRAVVDWGYNAWGNKYPPYDLDDAVLYTWPSCADCPSLRQALS
jgi:agmatine deiminase